MKNVKTLLVAGVILMVSITRSIAAGNENLNQAYRQMNIQLSEMLHKSDIIKSDAVKDTCYVVLTFSVNKKHKMKNVQVEGSDEVINRQVKSILKQKKVEVNPLFDGKSGQVLIMMENEG
jgi:hypothetical protein